MTGLSRRQQDSNPLGDATNNNRGLGDILSSFIFSEVFPTALPTLGRSIGLFSKQKPEAVASGPITFVSISKW